MKNIFKWIAMPALLATVFWSCKKNETIDYYTAGTNPVLTASDTALKFTPADSNKNAITVSWTNPNYQFTTGISSQNVNYSLQMDTLGANFTNPKMFTYSTANNLSKTFTVTEINSDLANVIGLATGVQHTVQMRVVSSLGSSNGAMLISNILQFNTTPYSPPALVTPPSTGTLYIVGAAAASGWNVPIPAANVVAQTFTKVSATEYKLTVALTGGAEYKLIGSATDANYTIQYSVAATDTYPNGGPFVANGNNSIAPSTSGTYVLDFNFQTGIFTVTPK